MWWIFVVTVLKSEFRHVNLKLYEYIFYYKTSWHTFLMWSNRDSVFLYKIRHFAFFLHSVLHCKGSVYILWPIHFVHTTEIIQTPWISYIYIAKHLHQQGAARNSLFFLCRLVAQPQSWNIRWLCIWTVNLCIITYFPRRLHVSVSRSCFQGEHCQPCLLSMLACEPHLGNSTHETAYF